MTTEERIDDKEKQRTPCGPLFGNPERLREIVKVWCQPGMKFCDCCPDCCFMPNAGKEEASRGTTTA